jgi:hypothetical protein
MRYLVGDLAVPCEHSAVDLCSQQLFGAHRSSEADQVAVAQIK